MLFFAFCLVGMGAAAADAFSRGHGTRVAVAWIAGIAVVSVVMAVRHAPGRLILRRADDREEQRLKNESSRSWSWPIVCLVVVVAAAGGAARDVAFGALGGALTAMAPVLLWVAFVLRPDEHPGADL